MNDPSSRYSQEGTASFPPPVAELAAAAISVSGGPRAILLEEIHWRVAAKDFWVVGALPGSGKSQLLQTAAGLLRPARGASYLFGAAVAELAASELQRARLRIGYVFPESGRLLQQLTVAQNVALPLCYHRNCSVEAGAELVTEILAITCLTPFGGWMPGQVNRAWWPRVALARALVLRPEVLFLDNPIAGLDPRQTRWWLDFLGQLSAGHDGLGLAPITVVVATDEFSPWLGLGRQFALVKEGRLLVLGGPKEVTTSKEPLLRELLADAPPTR